MCELLKNLYDCLKGTGKECGWMFAIKGEDNNITAYPGKCFKFTTEMCKNVKYFNVYNEIQEEGIPKYNISGPFILPRMHPCSPLSHSYHIFYYIFLAWLILGCIHGLANVTDCDFIKKKYLFISQTVIHFCGMITLIYYGLFITSQDSFLNYIILPLVTLTILFFETFQIIHPKFMSVSDLKFKFLEYFFPWMISLIFTCACLPGILLVYVINFLFVKELESLQSFIFMFLCLFMSWVSFFVIFVCNILLISLPNFAMIAQLSSPNEVDAAMIIAWIDFIMNIILSAHMYFNKNICDSHHHGVPFALICFINFSICITMLVLCILMSLSCNTSQYTTIWNTFHDYEECESKFINGAYTVCFLSITRSALLLFFTKIFSSAHFLDYNSNSNHNHNPEEVPLLETNI